MKIILSRKGFDSSYGGYHSPILPNGKMVSLPIPLKDDLTYSDLEVKAGCTYYNLMKQLRPTIKIGKHMQALDKETRLQHLWIDHIAMDAITTKHLVQVKTFESPAGSSSWSGTLELNIDLPGVNLDQGYTLSSTDDAHVCANYRANNISCMAFTYVRPGIQGPNAVCWLNKSVPRPFPSDCCISGVKFAPPEAAATGARPSISGSEAPAGGSSWGQSPPHIGWIDRESEIPVGGGSWGQTPASCISCEPDYQCLDNLTATRMGLPLWSYVDFSQCCITANFEFGHCWLSKASSPVDRWN